MKPVKLSKDNKELLQGAFTGLAIGGGIAGATNLVRYIKWLQEGNSPKNDTSVDDDTLYIKVPSKQQFQNKYASTHEALNTALPVITGVLGWYGADRLFNKIRNKQLQRELDREQVLYLQELSNKRTLSQGGTLQKKAAWGSETLGKGLGLMLLTALGSAAISHELFNKRFSPKTPSDNIGLTPVKVKVMRNAPDVLKQEEKVANVEISDAAFEAYIKLACLFNPTESNDTLNLIKYCAQHGVDTTKNLLRLGVDKGLNKAASVDTVSGIELSLTVERMVKNAFLKEVLLNTAALEHLNSSGNSFFKAASFMDENTRELLIKAFDAYSTTTKAAYYLPILKHLNKSAATLGMSNVFNDLLRPDPSQAQVQEGLQERSTTTSDVADPFEYNTDDPELVKFVNENKDAILSILNKK
jgi:hypothetical protein